MKVFAIQKTRTNTYSSQFKQDIAVGLANPTYRRDSNCRLGWPAQHPVSEDKFVSNKVSFGMGIKDLETELAKLAKQLELKELTEDAYEDLARPIRRRIRTLKCRYGLIETTESPRPPMGPDPTW